jgi:hypothetical protein
MIREAFAESIAAARTKAKKKYTNAFLQELEAAREFREEFKSRLRKGVRSKVMSWLGLGGEDYANR